MWSDVRPEATREKSSNSSMRRACRLALSEIDWSARAVFSPLNVPRCSIPAHPRMALSGVRSSCETTETNSSLKRLARSASARGPLRGLVQPRAVSACAQCCATDVSSA